MHCWQLRRIEHHRCGGLNGISLCESKLAPFYHALLELLGLDGLYRSETVEFFKWQWFVDFEINFSSIRIMRTMEALYNNFVNIVYALGIRLELTLGWENVVIIDELCMYARCRIFWKSRGWPVLYFEFREMSNSWKCQGHIALICITQQLVLTALLSLTCCLCLVAVSLKGNDLNSRRLIVSKSEKTVNLSCTSQYCEFHSWTSSSV